MDQFLVERLSEFIVLANSLAVLAIVLCGLSMMLPFTRRRFAARLFGIAVLLIVIGVYGPMWLPS